MNVSGPTAPSLAPQDTGAPVTAVIRRRVRPGHEGAYEDAVRRLQADARDLPGYLGAHVHRPAVGASEYTSVVRFAALADLDAFEASSLHAAFAREVAPHVEADAVWDRTTGLEVWFAPPPGTVVAQPSRLRMALLLIVVVFTLVLSIGGAVGLVLGAWPYPARLLVTIAIEVMLMTYVVMPPLTRALARWIYPATRTA